LLLLTIVAGSVIVTAVIAALVVASPWSPWWFTSGSSACGPPAEYRVDGSATHALGGCAGVFPIPPVWASVRVGQEVDVHMTEDESGSSGTAAPMTANSKVLMRNSLADGGATVSFQARSPGVALLETRALCQVMPPPAADEFTACTILAVTVLP
jgi:hypothetical protein